LVVPGPLHTRSGGYEYDRRMVAGLRARGWTVDVRPPAAIAAIPDGTCVIIDGLALGTMPDVVEREKDRLRLVALVHLPLAEDTGLDPAIAATLEAGERRALAACVVAIVTGTGTARTLERYGISRDRIAVIEPGTDAAPIARGSGGPSVHVICVAAVTRGKGHEMLIDALARVPSEMWALTCAGSLERDAATVERVRASLRGHALGNHVTLVGELDAEAVSSLYDRADLFAIATRHETYGMAVAEALARGLPVIGTETGAIPDLVGSDAGIVVPVGDTDALASALARAIDDAPLRAELAAGARRVRDRLPAWDNAVDKMVAVLEPIVA
jgi:glycosyltransferase involved in cell wall biosynthesis